MVCPDCDSDALPDNPKFGKVVCPQCKTIWRYSAEGLNPDTLKPRTPDTRFRMGPRIRLQTVIRCMVCFDPVERDATVALVQRAGGRWPIKGPVCKRCEGITSHTHTKEGEIVPVVRILPVMGFFLPESRSHMPIPDDDINREVRPRRQTLTGLRFEPAPDPINARQQEYQRQWITIHKKG